MRIGVFTLRSIEPLHPRLAAFTEYFDENSLSYDLIPGYRHAVFSRLNWTSFFFFDLWSVFKNREKTKYQESKSMKSWISSVGLHMRFRLRGHG